MLETRPFIVGVGGTTTAESTTECALAHALDAAARHGASVQMFGGREIMSLPHYLTPESQIDEMGKAFVNAVRNADGLIIASPGYHGSISGLLKNAIDYLEETSKDSRSYLDGVPVGLIATAYGWQATGSTLAALRSIVHALRGWPTPFGVTINSSDKPFIEGKCVSEEISLQLGLVGKQVVEFSKLNFSETKS